MSCSHEGDIQTAEKELEKVQDIINAKVNGMPPASHEEYEQSVWQKKEIEFDRAQISKQLLQMDNDIQKEMLKFSSDPEKIRAFEIQKNIDVIRYQLEAIELEANSNNSKLMTEEAILSQLQIDNAEIAAMERKVKEVDFEISRHHQKGGQFSGGSAGDHEASERLQEVYQEIARFLESYPSTKDANVQSIRTAEADIQKLTLYLNQMASHVSLLQEGIQSGSTSTPAEAVRFLIAENERKQQDLDKSLTLEVKLQDEIRGLNAEIAKFQNEIVRFSNVDQVKADALLQKKKSQEDKQALTKITVEMKSRLQNAESEYSTMRNKLIHHDAYQQLSPMEQRLKILESNVFHLREANQAMISEGNSESMEQEIAADLNSYNSQIREALSALLVQR
eukprot:Partr_v1_DN27559_c1_g1_i2_m30584 putative Intraflagellar transport 74 homolog (Chlamydomonas)